MTRKLWAVSGAAVLVLSGVGVYLVPWDTPVRTVEHDPGASPPAAESHPVVLAAADAHDPPGLRVEVLSVARVAPQVIELRVALVNRAGAATLSIGDRLAASQTEAGSLSGAYLDVGGAARYFVLRDGDGAPVCSRDVLAIPAGARREAWMRFVSPGPSAATAVLHLTGVPGIGPLPMPE